MNELNHTALTQVSGGEVGATGMGDDVHYSGSITDGQANALADCVGGAGGMDGGAFLGCMFFFYSR